MSCRRGLAACAAAAVAAASAVAPPKVILAIVVDDLGHWDVGFTHSGDNTTSVTPNIDALAREGVILGRHYVRVSSPARVPRLRALRF